MTRAEIKKSETFLDQKDIHPEILSVVSFLQQIQRDYSEGASTLRKMYGIENRGCGPGSFVLAVLVQGKLKDQGVELPLEASAIALKGRNDGIHIIFGTEKEEKEWIDHAWVEVQMNNQILIISHESQKHTSATSVRAAAARQDHMPQLYKEMGLKVAKNIQELQDQTGFSNELMKQAAEVLKDINKGEIPENYAHYVEQLLDYIRE